MKLRNLIFILLMSALFLFTVVPAQATPIWESDASSELTGSRTSPASSGVDATFEWNGGGFDIDWNVLQGVDDLWTYTYTIIALRKGLSHFILEVTEDDEDFVTYDGTTIQCGSDQWWDVNTPNANSNPDMPNPIYGVKFDVGTPDNTDTVVYTIITDRAPVYGVFYTKDGKDNASKEDVVAWSNALNFSNYRINEDLITTDFIVRPDGGGGEGEDDPPIPEPATMLLLGSGLIGFAVSGRKKLKKRNG